MKVQINRNNENVNIYELCWIAIFAGVTLIVFYAAITWIWRSIWAAYDSKIDRRGPRVRLNPMFDRDWKE